MRSSTVLLFLIGVCLVNAAIPYGEQPAAVRLETNISTDKALQPEPGQGQLEGRLDWNMALTASRMRYTPAAIDSGMVARMELIAPAVEGRYRMDYTLDGIRDGQCTRQVKEYADYPEGTPAPESPVPLVLTLWKNGSQTLRGTLVMGAMTEIEENCNGVLTQLEVRNISRRVEIEVSAPYPPEEEHWAGQAMVKAPAFGALEPVELMALSWNYRAGPPTSAASATSAGTAASTNVSGTAASAAATQASGESEWIRLGGFAAAGILAAVVIWHFYFGRVEKEGEDA